MRSARFPLPATYPFYALVEALGDDADRDRAAFEDALARAIEDGVVADTVIAQSERERQNLWAVRDDIQEPFKPLFPLFAFDVSLALGDMPGFAETTRAELQAKYPGVTAFYFGHAGDGNIHVIVSTGQGDQETEREVDGIIYSALQKCGGSVAAELGVGREKRPFIDYTRTPEEIAFMQTIKRAVDPRNIMNPDKIFPMST